MKSIIIIYRSFSSKKTLPSFLICINLLFLSCYLSPIYSQKILTVTNLPIIIIDTDNQTINDDTKIISNMGIINGEDLNYTIDDFNDFNGKVSIEHRGASSLSFPKKSFSFETQDSIGNNLNVSLLGLPSENDWVLYGPFGDQTFIRNALTYSLYSKMGYYSPKFRFCELLLNNEYMGLYLLIEKIKRDKNRLNLEKMNSKDEDIEDISGGYILQIDRGSENHDKYWTSSYTSSSGDSIYYQYIYPKWKNINPNQKSYVQQLIYNFESSIINNSGINLQNLYDKTINVNSFIDYFIINELSKNIDAYRLSTYLYKNHDDIDKRIHIGPVWDFNWAYGNSSYCEADIISGWEVNTPCGIYNPLWYSVLTEDSLFNNLLKCRWNSLRMNILNENNIAVLIDSIYSSLKGGIERDYLRWGKEINYAEQIVFLKNWLNKRIEWIDAHMNGDCVHEPNNTPKQLIKIVDVLGRETLFKPNIPLLYIYDDGTVEKKVVLK